MSTTPLHRAIAVLPLALALGLLAACSGGGGPSAEASKAANDKAAARFVACLTDQGQTAKIVQPKGTDQAMVGILQSSSDAQGGPDLSTTTGPSGGSQMQIMMFSDADGSWLLGNTADAYPEDGGQRAAWKACTKKVPEFTQPKPKISGGHTITEADAAKATLKFAKCARSNGFPDFADPDSQGQLSLPTGITEDEFRALLTACVAKNGPLGIGFTKESTDGLGFDWMSVMNEFLGAHIKNGPDSGGAGAGSSSGSK